jgi:dipeptidyl aminopeptidase/acylaminoacyl peptidase
MLTDLEDATTAALKSGMFDPKRVAVMGWGFGGYCAYMCAIRSPGLFACGVTVDAIVDWTDRSIKSNASNPDYYGFDEEHLGDPKADPAAFAQMTPLGLAENIKIPFLVAYDDMGNPDRSDDKKMVKAMKKAGCNIQTVDGYSNGSFYTQKGSLDLYPKVAEFLDAHMK